MSLQQTQIPAVTADGSTQLINPLDGSGIVNSNLLGM
jgi:hypothetical protein